MATVTDETDFVTWLIEEMEQRGWSNSELARRIGVSPSNVHVFVSRKRNPTWDFCAGVARAFGMSEDEVFRKAGLLPSLPSEVANEREAVRILRTLSEAQREAVMAMLRGLRGQRVSTPVPSAAVESRPASETLLEFDSSHYRAELGRLVNELAKATDPQQREEIQRRIDAVSVDWLGDIWDRCPPETWHLIVLLLRDAAEKIERGEELEIAGRELQRHAEQERLIEQIALRAGELDDEGKQAILDMIDYVRKAQGGAENGLDSEKETDHSSPDESASG